MSQCREYGVTEYLASLSQLFSSGFQAAIKAEGSSIGNSDATSQAAIATHMSKFKELFDEADLNSDGKLDKDEMAQNLKEREEWIKGEAASETMEVADDNKDGKVSLNEVIKNAGEYGAKTEDFFEVHSDLCVFVDLVLN